ncbi:MAG TPA: MlaE family lipid ABC transporter permease subunit [Burkholderiaceae bacterium]|jgi:phospholipid/cholesterol/gamma-HCH transport system permease protein|nr:MlaE family lipid ABC transporter permease subunit [Burkholderiaceae bacterium]
MAPEGGVELALAPGAPHELRCRGVWSVRTIAELEKRLAGVDWPAGELTVDGSGVTVLDTSGAWLLHRTLAERRAQGAAVRLQGFKAEFAAMLQLLASRSIPLQPPLARTPPWLVRVGQQTSSALLGLWDYLAFVGESALALLAALRHPRRLRWRPILRNVQIAGVDALPITGLLSFLMGIVIAYQGADQLQRFGANIFVVDLVALAMLRELSPLLTAIIVAGRSGSAYTAQIGTMKVTEEIDALRTIGVTPQDVLVLPKVIALVIVMPLLTVYTDVTGVAGGMLMAKLKLGVGYAAFVDRLDEAIQLSSYWTGLAKAPVFALIVALVGCHRGFQVGGSADSVGAQTTVSVVQSIFLVIVTDALFSIVFLWLDL